MPEFEPYPDLPEDQLPSPEKLAVGRANAQWAKTFEGGTTNLATRAKHAQDIRSYAGDVATIRAADRNQLLSTNKDAHAMWMKERAATLNEEKASFNMAQQRIKADEALKMAPLIFKAKEAQTAAQVANAARTAAQNLRMATLQQHADQYLTELAQAPLDLTPEQLDEWKVERAARFPGASQHEETAKDIAAARSAVNARRAEAARADAATLANTRRMEAAAKPRDVKEPATPESSVISSIDRKLVPMEAQWRLEKARDPKSTPKSEKEIEALRMQREEIRNPSAGQASPPTATKRFNRETGQIEPIKKIQ